jgi:dTDP-glucose 4,6-dehydratase
MNLAGQPVLVTGADGFIGSHLTEALVRLGCKVRAFSFYNAMGLTGWLEDLPADIKASVEIITGDVRDPARIDEAVQGCAVVFHLAALIGIPYSYHAPESYVDTNIKGTVNVLQAARRHGCSRVIHTSTSEVYGTARSVPISEDHPLQPQSPYSASKIAADNLALSYFYSFALPVCILRPFNTYGPRQSNRAVIPTIITQIHSGLRTLKLGTLESTRDFSYVSDTVAGFIRAASSDRALGEVINLGSGFEIGIGDTAQMIARLMNADIDIQTEAARLRPEHSEVFRLLSDNNKARNLLEWQPEYLGLEGFSRGLEKTIAWFTEPAHAAFYKPQIYNI